MQKKLLSSLIAVGVASPLMVNADTLEIPTPTFYGKFNVTQEWVSPDADNSYSRLKSNSSRLGVKGSFTLNEYVKAIYQAEFGLDVDSKGDKDKNAITRRNTFIGLDSDYGKVIAGVFDSPLKLVQNKIDVFNGVQGDIKNVITNSEQRIENTVQYSTPTIAGFAANLAYINADNKDDDNGFSGSLTWNYNKLYLAAAMDNKVLDEDTKTIRLAGQYTLGVVQLGALWEREEDGLTDTNNSGWLGSALVKTGDKIALKAQYGQSDIVKEDGKTLSLGVDYSFSKNAKTFAYVTQEEFKVEDKTQYYGVGLEYSF